MHAPSGGGSRGEAAPPPGGGSRGAAPPARGPPGGVCGSAADATTPTVRRALGTCYYPEHWPEDVWAQDARRMAETGLTWVRIGEFAWSRLEPGSGDLRWDWLDRAIGTLGRAGLSVVLGTPSATPPRWMLDRHPDMLAVDPQGRPRRFGSRRHYDFSHDGYREEAARITRLLGERYGRHPHVRAWQIDNEYDCHGTAVSYSTSAAFAFREWCEARYGTLGALNEAWGTVFWSMEYGAWDQIDPPNLSVTEPNPAHALAFRRFSSDQVIRFHRAQVDALRPLTDAPLIHNFMGFVAGFDHWMLGRDIDVAAWDSYPLGFLSDRIDAPPEHKARYLRQGDPDMQAFHHDLYRGVGRGRLWVMEQQPGPVNWAPWNPAPLPGMARLWAWEAFAHGAEAVLYFRWRQAPFGQEQNHAGLLRPDSAPAPALSEAAEVAREIDAAPEVAAAPAPAALVLDYASAWMWEIQPQGRDFDYLHLCLDVYRGLRRLGLSIDLVPPDADLAPYRLVLAPGLATLPEGLSARSAGSDAERVVVLGPRAGARTPEFRIPVPLPPAVPGLDCAVALVESLPPGAVHPVEGGGHVHRWREELEGRAEVSLRLADGRPLMMRAGGLRYLGGWPDAEALGRILRDACAEAGIEVLDLPRDVRVRDAGPHRFWFNHGPDAVSTHGHDLPPAGVHREDRA